MSYRKARTQSVASTSIRRRRALASAVDYVVEGLERRRLFSVTLNGGGDINGVPQEPTQPFEFLDNAGNAVRIALLGDITATFTFVHVTTTTPGIGTTSFAEPVDPTAANIAAKAGSFLFNIDVTSAAPDASISIAEVPLPNTTGAPRPMEPFGAPEYPTFVVNSAQPDKTPFGTIAETLDANIGAIVLGAVDYTTPPGGGTAAETLPIGEFQDVTAGLTVAPGVSMNRFFFGGTVLGRVDIGGSIDTFYAGQILTGQAQGIDQGDVTDSTAFESNLVHNFNVSGDIANLISKGAIGTTDSASATVGAETYDTLFRMSVEGHIGEIQAGGITENSNFFGSVIVQDSASFKGLGTTQHEEEGDVSNVPDPNHSAFEGDVLVGNTVDMGVPTLGGTTAQNGDEADFNNNTIGAAQILGTLFSSQYGHGAIQLEGSLNGDGNVNDRNDFYGVALDGGQTVSFTLTPTESANDGSLALGVFSPEALTAPNSTSTATTGLLASTFESPAETGTAGQTITITATEPGIYYIAVAFAGDADFNGNPSVIPLYEIDYNLAVTGVGDVAIGGLKAQGEVNFPGGLDPAGGVNDIPSLTAERGDIGAILSGTTIEAGSSDAGEPEAIDAAAGNIRVVQAGTDIGANTNIIGQHYSPTLATPKDVGLVQTGGLMLINADSASPIGGSYQLLDAGTTMGSPLYADVGIGTIRAQSVASTDYPIVWHVNDDSKGADGVIDLIAVTGNGNAPISGSFGSAAEGGPEIMTGPGGNVRYMDIAPTVTVYNDNFFGGGFDDVIHYAQGAAVTITDDSGTPVIFYPSKARNNVAGDLSSASTATSTAAVTSDVGAGTLSALTYGIEGSGGVVIINMTEVAGDITVNTTSASTTTSTITSTVNTEDAPVSLSIATSARGTNGSADIGTLNVVTEAGEASTFDPDTQKFTTTAGNFGLAEDLGVSMTGKSPINVWNTVASDAPMLLNTSQPTGETFDNTLEPGLAGVGTISNATSGEIVNVQAEDVVSINAQTIGMAESHTDSAVGGAVLDDNFPFFNQRTLVAIGGGVGVNGAGTGGNAQSIIARGALGNIVVAGNIGTVEANSGGGTSSASAGNSIVAPIVALTGAGASAIQTATVANGVTTITAAPSGDSGNILLVNIGRGLGYSGTGSSANTGIFASNTIEDIVNQGEGSDIRGDIVASDLNGGLPTPIVISTVTGLPEPTRTGVVTGEGINAINLTGGGSLIGAHLFVVTAFIQAAANNFSGFIFESGNVGNEQAATVYAIGTINLTGNGGIIGTEFIGGVGSIDVPTGFGMINSDLVTLNNDQVGSIKLGGYGMRSDIVTGQNSVGSIDLTGLGQQLPITDYTPSVRQSESGATVDAFSGQPLDTSSDLDLFLNVTKKKPTRKSATQAGVLADSNLTGSDSLGSITAFRMVSNLSATSSAAAIAVTPAMVLDFAQSIGTIEIKQDTIGAQITTGGITAFDSGDEVIGTKVNVAGNIADMTAGFINGSTHINATGPDGTIDLLKTSKGFNGQINASVDIGEVSVGQDLDSIALGSSGNLDKLIVDGEVLGDTDVRVAKTIGSLIIKRNILGGASIQAKAITKQVIGGQVFGNIVITG